MHSRTAFEHTLWVSFYAWFLYFYLRYRTDKPKHLITAVVFAALSFYSYNGGQLGIVILGLLLLGVDWRYHRQQRRTVFIALGTACLCALPYARFQLTHSAEVSQHLQLLGSYWVQDLPLAEKLARAVSEYAHGLRPDYWFAPDNAHDLIRHQLKGYGNLLWITLPFIGLGLIIALKQVFTPSRLSVVSPQSDEENLRPAYRVILLALLVAPLGGLLVQTNVLRDLVIVIPATLLITIGLAAVLEWIVRFAVRRSQRAFKAVALITCAVLVFANLSMLHDALTNGPTWYDDYGLAGLQYGAPQVFSAIGQYLDQKPQDEVWLFPSWLNGSEMLRRYFLPDDPRVHLLDFDGFLASKFDLTDQTLLIMDRTNYQRLIDSRHFADVQIQRVIPLPNESAGYYFITARYSPDIDQLLEQEQPAFEQAVITLDHETWQVRYTPLHGGVIQQLFDADPTTATTLRSPATLDITLPSARALTSLTLASDERDLRIAIEVYADRANQAGRYESAFNQVRPDQPIELEFDPPPGPVNRIRLTIHNLDSSDRLTLRDLSIN
jgi:hypothetical protein